MTSGPPPPPDPAETPETAQRPELEATPFSGPAFHLSAQRGKWVLVYYWASWCPPCTKAMPVVSRFVAAHRDVAAIGLAVMQPKAQDAERFASAHDPGFPLAWLDADATQRLTRITGKLVGIPFTWLIAPDGTTEQQIEETLNGMNEVFAKAWLAAETQRQTAASTPGHPFAR